MIALTTEQVQQIQLAAHALPIEVRCEFLALVAAQLKITDIDVADCIRRAQLYVLQAA